MNFEKYNNIHGYLLKVRRCAENYWLLAPKLEGQILHGQQVLTHTKSYDFSHWFALLNCHELQLNRKLLNTAHTMRIWKWRCLPRRLKCFSIFTCWPLISGLHCWQVTVDAVLTKLLQHPKSSVIRCKYVSKAITLSTGGSRSVCTWLSYLAVETSKESIIEITDN